MPRLPSTSWAPRPTRASRTRDFTRLELRVFGGVARRGTRKGRRSGAGGQQPGQVAVQTRSRSTWIRATRRTPVEATSYVYQTDRQCRGGVPANGTRVTSTQGRRLGWQPRTSAGGRTDRRSATFTAVPPRKAGTTAAGSPTSSLSAD